MDLPHPDRGINIKGEEKTLTRNEVRVRVQQSSETNETVISVSPTYTVRLDSKGSN